VGLGFDSMIIFKGDAKLVSLPNFAGGNMNEAEIHEC